MFLTELEFIGFGEFLTETADLVFQFQPLRFVLLRHVHEPLFRNLIFRVILKQFFVQTGDLVTSGKSPVDFFLKILLLLENIAVGLVRQDLDERLLVVSQKLGKTAKLQQYDLFDSVRSDIVACGTGAAIVLGVVRTRKEVYLFVDRVRVIPKLIVAIPAVKIIRKQMLLTVVVLR